MEQGPSLIVLMQRLLETPKEFLLPVNVSMLVSRRNLNNNPVFSSSVFKSFLLYKKKFPNFHFYSLKIKNKTKDESLNPVLLLSLKKLAF
jgi:hypothetical protein